MTAGAATAALAVGLVACPPLLGTSTASSAGRLLAVSGTDRAPTSSAAVVARPAGGYEVFYRGWNGVVFDRSFVAGKWSAPTSLGGQTVGAPAAAAFGNDVVLVTRGPANGLNIRVRSAGHWSALRSLGITVTAAPAVTASGSGRVDVVARGQDRKLYTRTLQRSTPTTPWRGLSARATFAAPAAAATGNGQLTVLMVNSRHELMRRMLAGGTWSGWTSVGGRTWDAPAVAAVPGTSRVLALFRGTNNKLYSRELPSGTWRARGGALIDAPAVATGPKATHVVVVRDRSTGFATRTVRAGTWSGTQPAWGPTAAPPPRPALLGTDWTRIPTSRKVVALTFDAGANADGYGAIRTALEKANVPATFFLTGAWVRAFPALANDVAESGFVVGSHTDTHPHLPALTNAQIEAQVRTARAAIINCNGVDPRPLFRFPYGDVNTRVLSEVNRLGYVAVRWTVDTLGWEGTSGGMTVQKVINRVVDGARPGAIVLMHTGSNPKDHTTLDAAALPTVIRRLRALGYGFVTLDALTG